MNCWSSWRQPEMKLIVASSQASIVKFEVSDADFV